MSEFVGKAPLTIVVLKSGPQKYVYEGDPYPDDAAEGQRERHHDRGFVGAEDESFDVKTKTWSKTSKADSKPAPKP